MSSSPTRSPALSHCSTSSDRKLPNWCVAPAHGAQITVRIGSTSTPISIDLHRAYSIGSDPNCDIPFPNLRISAEHALLLHSRGGSVFVQDLGSESGTRLDASPIPPNVPTRWAPGSVLTLGDACVLELANLSPSPRELLASADEDDEVTKSNTEMNRHVVIEEGSRKPISKRSSSEHVKFVAYSQFAFLLQNG